MGSSGANSVAGIPFSIANYDRVVLRCDGCVGMELVFSADFCGAGFVVLDSYIHGGGTGLDSASSKLK